MESFIAALITAVGLACGAFVFVLLVELFQRATGGRKHTRSHEEKCLTALLDRNKISADTNDIVLRIAELLEEGPRDDTP